MVMAGIGLALGAANSIGRWISGAKQKRLANQINPIWKQYQTSPYAKQQLGIAQQMFNGRMSGAGAMERNIASGQAGQLANIGRNATDSSQALALAMGTQGQANSAYGNLAQMEGQNKAAMYQNLERAYGTMINEGQLEHGSIIDKFDRDVMQKNALTNAGMNNQYGAINDIGSAFIKFQQMKDAKKTG
jgi:hypothetical protein